MPQARRNEIHIVGAANETSYTGSLARELFLRQHLFFWGGGAGAGGGGAGKSSF